MFPGCELPVPGARRHSRPRWNPADYAANSSVQESWARELIAKLKLRGDEQILDVGCGDGKVTAALARAVPKGGVTGVDASPEMIRFAQSSFSAKKYSNLEFQLMDASKLSLPRKFDVVFSNAVLHWVSDHPGFLRGAAAALVPGGRLMTSCGGQGNAQEVFLAIRSILRLKQWREYFRGMDKPYYFHSPAEYEKWLPRFGFKPLAVRLAPKDAVYPDPAAFEAWLRSTWLPYVQKVPDDLRETFIKTITDRYLTRHPADDSGQVHVRMVRLEIEATRI